MSDQWVDVVFVQGEEYDAIAELGIQEMAEYLAKWDYGQETDDAHTHDEKPWGTRDWECEVSVGGLDYILAYSHQYGHASLNRRPLA
ncbi:hypothetical protein [Mycobacterium avium]|uniref:hypothetical protein n=1 Tax=Mycobacterium avium TaxID=1764 RepID=UPI000CE32074|nr:hypothetical protein [Mycobacterium avium]